MKTTRHTLTLWTNDAGVAGSADRAGVDRIGLDLERIGKHVRQEGHATWLSEHREEDLGAIAPRLHKAALFARSNPLNPGSAEEIERLLGRGVEVLMLPYFADAGEVACYLELVSGRASVVPLVERLSAVDSIRQLPALGITEIHVGLNDLSIELGARHRLASLVSPCMERIAAAARGAGLTIGIGGLGRANDRSLPIPSDLVYAQQARLGSSGAMIAQSFFRADMTAHAMGEEIAGLRRRLREWFGASAAELECAHRQLAELLSDDRPIGDGHRHPAA